jgi:hypothetical protein
MTMTDGLTDGCVSDFVTGRVQADQLNARQRRKLRRVVYPYLHDDEMTKTVIAGFLLINLDAFQAWIGELLPAERGDCLNWIIQQLDMARARRRLAWLTGKQVDQALARAADDLMAQSMAASEEGKRLFDSLCDFKSESHFPPGK